jgi:hypothetical protein
LPDLDGGELLVEILSAIGECKSGANGLMSVEWQDIANWVNLTNAELTAGEVEAVKYLSLCYVSQHYQSIDRSCPPPNIETLPVADEVTTKLKSLFAMLRK